MSSLNKIHVTSSTGLTLNDRFTAIAKHRVRSRSQTRQTRNIENAPVVQPVNPNVATANRRLLLQLERRHKMLAAMKLKRRSLRAPPSAMLKRGTIKALRVGANGKPIKANSLTKFATMNADLISNGRRRSRSLRRAGSVTPVVNRLGLRAGRSIGGAAERVAKRRMARLRSQLKRNGDGYVAPVNRRSRSRVRPQLDNMTGVVARGRTMSRGRSTSRGRSQSRGPPQNRGRSQSRGRSQTRNRPIIANANVRRGRSMSRNRANVASNQNALPVKARLGVRTGNATTRPRNRSVNGRRNVIRGRIQKRPGTTQNGQYRNGTGGGNFQARGRSRSRSRTRKVQTNNKGQLQNGAGVRNGRMSRRGRSAQRGFGNGNANGKRNNQPQKQQQQRRGRSRSRRGDGRNIGKNNQQTPNKDDLDKELDQYMATTKTENDMGYLLRN